jgi:hypothetical protein
MMEVVIVITSTDDKKLSRYRPGVALGIPGG